MNTDNPLHAILDQMDERGGSFVRSLAKTITLADPENRELLLAAIPGLIDTYDGYATAAANRRAGKGLMKAHLPSCEMDVCNCETADELEERETEREEMEDYE